MPADICMQHRVVPWMAIGGHPARCHSATA
jgi:hypothetical protein